MFRRIVDWLIKDKVKRLRVGDEIILWPACDLREDHLVVDLSRLLEGGMVGIKSRLWGVLRSARGQASKPDYPDRVEWIRADYLWTCFLYAAVERKRRQPELGSLVELWNGAEYEERLVVDLSRKSEGLVGIKRRRRPRGRSHLGDFPPRVDFIQAEDFVQVELDLPDP